mgnify:CR=1 FL=1
MDLTTRYLGLELPCPIMVGACPLTGSVEGVRACAEAGAGGVVLRSLFEEQIRANSQDVADALSSETSWHTEAYEYMQAQIGIQYGTRDYLQLIRDCKREVDIPVIASINCVDAEWWLDFAREVEAAGADAIELNIAIMPMDFDSGSEQIEAKYAAVVRGATEAVSVAVGVKVPPTFTALGKTVLDLRRAGAKGFVLFNRLYRPTISIHDMALQVRDEDRYSHPLELNPSLRWISFFANRIDADFVGNTGVHSGEDVLRCLLAGASAVQCVSTLMHNGVDHLRCMVRDLRTWMSQREFSSLEDFRGHLSQAANPEAAQFGRLQYIEGLLGTEG